MSIAIRKMPFGFRLPSGRLAWIVTAVLLLLGTATAAYGFWASTTSSNNATAAADTLAPGSKPAVTANGASLSVRWAAGTTVNGRAATGYTVTRYAAATGGTGTPATGGCAGTVTTPTCTEQNVPGGIWYYTVTPTIALWTGAESPRSSGVSSDSTAPIASVSGLTPAPNAAGWNNTSPVTVAITANDGAGGSGVASISYMVDGGAQQTVSGASASVSVTGDGTHSVSYFATDNAGNAGTAQSQTVRIDTTAPAAPGLSVPAYVNLANVAAVPVTGTAEAGAKITLTASDTGAAHSAPPVTTTADSTGNWAASIDLSSLNQGTVTYSAVATDAAGNVGPAGKTTSTKDTVAPAVAQAVTVPTYINNASTQGANTANASSVPVSGTAEVSASVTVTATDSAGHSVSGTAVASGLSGGWSLNLNLGSSSAMVDGIITYTVTVTDPAGNTGSAVTPSPTSTKDTAAPSPAQAVKVPTYINIASPSANSAIASSVPVSGTAEANGAVTVKAADSAGHTVSGNATASSPGGNWSLNLDLGSSTLMVDGTITYTITVTDAAGNTGSPVTPSPTSKRDTVAPAVRAVSLASVTNGQAGVGTIDKGDSVRIPFSEAMDLSKFCPGLSATTGLNGTATISNGTDQTKDMLTFSTSSCPGIVSINLGADYVGSTSAVFAGTPNGGSGNVSNPSTLTWETATNTLVITLGALTSGSVPSSSPNSYPVYTPASGLTDVAGNPLPVVASTTPAASRF